MRGSVLSLLIASVQLILAAPAAQAEHRHRKVEPPAPWVRTWALPAPLNDQNSDVRFEIDSTFHLVEGKTSGVTGKIWLENPDDPLSIRGKIELPVNLFVTGNDSRDETLREVMAEDKFPKVTVDISGVLGGCTPKLAEREIGCDGKLQAKLTIRDVAKDLALPYTVKYVDGKYRIAGKISFYWSDFHVEDPSSFFARVDKTVHVLYQCDLGARPTEK